MSLPADLFLLSNMEIVNLLDFLHNTRDICDIEYAGFNNNLVNILDLLNVDEQFTQKIQLGIIYYSPLTLDQYAIVDGLNRIVSLSLLLHAICECYKKTSERNDRAIKTIRSKYLLNGNRSKLRLSGRNQELYDKIINGERLSGKEKESKMFQLLHNYWVKIKEEKLLAANIFKMLQRVYVITAVVEPEIQRDVYYALKQDSHKLDQFALIRDYLKNIGIVDEWKNLLKIFPNKSDFEIFLRDYFITKFSLEHFDENKLYENFVNYFETMLQYIPEDILISKIIHSACNYRDLLNVNINNENIRKALIQVKMHGGEDTFAYLLNIYEDYLDNNLSESTFLEILSTIDEYLIKRLKTPNNVSFNELIQYLNAFITCK